MGFLDIFKATENEKLRSEIDKLNEIVTPEYKSLLDLDQEINNKENIKLELEEEIRNIEIEKEEIINSIKLKKKEIIELDDEILLQEYNLYKPIYNFDISGKYKEALNNIRKEQKDMIKEKTCVSYFNNWIVKEKEEENKKRIENTVKQVIMAFNAECDNLIDKVKFNNIESIEARIKKTFEILNKLNCENKIYITKGYLDLKLEELHLLYEYSCKKQEEKDEQKSIKEEIKDKEKFKKEVTDRKKELNNYINYQNNLLIDINNKLLKISISKEDKKELLNDKKKITNEILKIELELKQIEKREKRSKSGYIYIVSNIGAFGEDIYKIGATKRLNPKTVIDELENESIPFKFDIHAIVYTEDVISAKNEIYRELEDKRLNKVSTNQSFFKAKIKLIEKVVKTHCSKEVNFIRTAEAREYRESLLKLNINENSQSLC